MHEFDSIFPRYKEFSPKVPVWCLTTNIPGCIHRFFDTSPISPSGRFLAVFRLPFEDRMPVPGDEGDVYVIDMASGECRHVARTKGWEPQLGANINWGGTDRELYFNDAEGPEWRPFSRKHDIFSGKCKKMEGAVYHASPDGKWLISADMRSMRRTQPGYGIVAPEDKIPYNIGPSKTHGFYLTDTSSGKTKILSIQELLEQANPPVQIKNPGKQEIYGFHSKFSPQGDKLMLSLRWFRAGKKPRLNMFKLDHKSVKYAWITVDLKTKSVYCSAGPELWEKWGHHATWFPDGEKISMNLNIDGDYTKFVQVNYDGSGLKKIHETLFGSGHPTVYPSGRYILTDSYNFEPCSFKDGTVPIRWIDLKEETDTMLIRINTEQPHPEIALRVDPHPAWDRTWRYVVFNGFVGGTRKVFLADMQSIISQS